MPSSPPCAVLLETARPLDAAAIGRVLAALLGLSAPDAARRARYCGGIVLESAGPDLAACAIAELAAEGIGARLVATGALPAIERPRRVTRAEVADDALDVVTGGRAERVAWMEPRLVLAWALDADLPAGRRGERDPALRRARDPEVLLAGEDHGLSEPTVRLLGAVARRRREEGRDAALGIDLVLPGGRVLRLERHDLEQVRAPELRAAAAHSAEALLALGRAIAGRAAAALRPAETAALVERGLLEPSLFLDPDELARYERWLLAPPAAAPSAPSAP